MQYSKILPIITGIIFIGTLIKGFTMDFGAVMDTTFYVSGLTISGGLFGSAIISYLRKAQLENVQKIKGNIYSLATTERLRFIEESYKLKIKYGMTDSDIEEAEMISPMDEFENDALNSMSLTGDMAMDEASEKVEIQTY